MIFPSARITGMYHRTQEGFLLLLLLLFVCLLRNWCVKWVQIPEFKSSSCLNLLRGGTLDTCHHTWRPSARVLYVIFRVLTVSMYYTGHVNSCCAALLPKEKWQQTVIFFFNPWILLICTWLNSWKQRASYIYIYASNSRFRNVLKQQFVSEKKWKV